MEGTQRQLDPGIKIIIARSSCQKARYVLQASCIQRLPQSYPLLDSPDPSRARYWHLMVIMWICAARGELLIARQHSAYSVRDLHLLPPSAAARAAGRGLLAGLAAVRDSRLPPEQRGPWRLASVLLHHNQLAVGSSLLDQQAGPPFPNTNSVLLTICHVPLICAGPPVAFKDTAVNFGGVHAGGHSCCHERDACGCGAARGRDPRHRCCPGLATSPSFPTKSSMLALFD